MTSKTFRSSHFSNGRCHRRRFDECFMPDRQEYMYVDSMNSVVLELSRRICCDPDVTAGRLLLSLSAAMDSGAKPPGWEDQHPEGVSCGDFS